MASVGCVCLLGARGKSYLIGSSKRPGERNYLLFMHRNFQHVFFTSDVAGGISLTYSLIFLFKIVVVDKDATSSWISAKY